MFANVRVVFYCSFAIYRNVKQYLATYYF